MTNPALPKAEYIERKFDELVLALQPVSSHKQTSAITKERIYFVKLTPTKINNWSEVSKQNLMDLSIPELILKYTALKHEKEREYGM